MVQTLARINFSISISVPEAGVVVAGIIIIRILALPKQRTTVT